MARSARPTDRATASGANLGFEAKMWAAADNFNGSHRPWRMQEPAGSYQPQHP